MNGKSTKTASKGNGRATASNGGAATANGRTVRPAPPAVAKALRALTAEVDALKNRLTQMEEQQMTQGKAYHVPQSLAELPSPLPPPAGMTPMQAIMGRLDVEETTEELLAQLKALD